MPTLDCPECNRRLKLADELAGRKVRCPSCQAVLSVPAADVASAPPRRPEKEPRAAVRPPPFEAEDRSRNRPRRPREDDEDDSRDVERSRPRSRYDENYDERPDRPRKSKKGLWIGLSVGGGVLLVALVVVLILVLGGGGGPTKERAVQTLQELVTALETKNYERAEAILQPPPGHVMLDAATKKRAMDRLLSSREISRRGVEILGKAGTWGPLEAVHGASGKRWAEQAGVPIAQCYGLKLGNAEAAFFWNGSAFRVFRCDDIGKLE